MEIQEIKNITKMNNTFDTFFSSLDMSEKKLVKHEEMSK